MQTRTRSGSRVVIHDYGIWGGARVVCVPPGSMLWQARRLCRVLWGVGNSSHPEVVTSPHARPEAAFACGVLPQPCFTKQAVTTARASSPTCLATSQASCGLTRAAILCQIPCRDPRLRYVAQCTRCLCTTEPYALCGASCGLFFSPTGRERCQSLRPSQQSHQKGSASLHSGFALGSRCQSFSSLRLRTWLSLSILFFRRGKTAGVLSFSVRNRSTQLLR